MSQTAALFVEAYRELNAKKLFWITLVLSLVFAAAIAALGIHEDGISVFWFQLDFPLSTTVMSEETFYKLVFVNIGIGLWLAWIAAILALVSTAQIFPDFISGGSIELALSKPISRTRLFLTKYFTGLFFVALQVTAFSAACFLVIGLRGGAWEPALFLAVPLVVLFFSYLFSVCALLGLITRSTIAALLLTLLFWFIIFVINSFDAITLSQLTRHELTAQRTQETIKRTEPTLDQRRQQLEDARAALDEGEPRPSERERVEELERRVAGGEAFLETLDQRKQDAEDAAGTWRPWYTGGFIAKTVLPKTGETVGLLERWLIDLADLDTDGFAQPNGDDPIDDNAEALFGPGNAPTQSGIDQDQVNQEVQKRYRERSVAWVLGTSLGFELVILAIACLYFHRKDF